MRDAADIPLDQWIRFHKVVRVMRSATLDGERRAARHAATRLAERWGLTLARAAVSATAAWEAAEKRRFQQALQEARQRGLVAGHPETRCAPPRTFFSAYRPTAADRQRLIGGLLREGAPLARIVALADATALEVAKVWLQMRGGPSERCLATKQAYR